MRKVAIITLCVLLSLSGCSLLLSENKKRTPTPTPIQTETTGPSSPLPTNGEPEGDLDEKTTKRLEKIYEKTINNNSITIKIKEKYNNKWKKEEKTIVIEKQKNKIYKKKEGDILIETFETKNKMLIKQTSNNNEIYIKTNPSNKIGISKPNILFKLINKHSFSTTENNSSLVFRSTKLENETNLDSIINFNTKASTNLTIKTTKNGIIEHVNFTASEINGSSKYKYIVNISNFGSTNTTKPKWAKKAIKNGINYEINKSESYINITYKQGPKIPPNSILYVKIKEQPRIISINKTLTPGEKYHVWISSIDNKLKFTSEPSKKLPPSPVFYKDYRLSIINGNFTYIIDGQSNKDKN